MNGITDQGLVVCEGCGTVHDDATQLIKQLVEHRDGLEADLRGKRSAISRLKGEQDAALRASPHYGDAHNVLLFWQETCSPKARELDGERLRLVIARLKGKYLVADLKLSVLGYARFPYVSDRGRSATGTPSQWQADADLIFRSAKHVDAGLRLAQRQVQAAPRELGMIPWRQAQAANRRLIVDWLETRQGPGLTREEFRRWGCPKCAGALWVAPVGAGKAWLACCNSCGLTDEELLPMILDDQGEDVPPQLSLDVAA
jgi:hypothetical protein